MPCDPVRQQQDRQGLRALRAFLDWPMLWTRLYCTAALIFFGVQLDCLRVSNSDTILHRSLADGYQWGGLAVIGFYVAPKVFSAFVQWKLGSGSVVPNVSGASLKDQV